MREPSAYWTEFAERFRELGFEVALIGGVAASSYRAEERFTTDVDFIARSLDGLPEQMEADGYEVKVMSEPGGDPYLLFLRGNGVKVDVQLVETPFQESALERAQDGVITAEDVIVFKLLAGRPRDKADVASILDAEHDLDVEYIERWAAEWGTLDLWNDALRQREQRR